MAKRIKGMRIDVTGDDIQNGHRAGCYDCPVALAIERATGEEAHVFGSTVMLNGDSRRTYRLPNVALARIDAYDGGRSMEPFSFELMGRDGR